MGLPGRDSREARCGWPRLAAALALTIAVTAGCYPNPDDLRPGGPGGTQGSLTCSQFGEKWCAQYSRCHPLSFGETFPDVSGCRDRMETYCTSILLAEEDTGWTPAQLGACATGWRSMTCTAWNDDPSILPGAACQVAGGRAQGASCFRDIQCGSGHCNFGSGTCGTCGPPAGAGQACTYSTECQAGSGCSGNGACVAWGNLGDACGGDRPCHLTLTCAAGHCAMPGGPGAACTEGTDCDGARGLLCNFTTQRCGQAIPTHEQCDGYNADGQVRYCAANGFCDSDTGVCTPAVGDGLGCDDDKGPRCLWPAFCSTVTHTCTLPTPVSCSTPDNGGTSDGGTGGTGGADGGNPNPTLDTALNAYAQSVCSRLQACAPRRVIGFYGSLASCQTRFKLFAKSISTLTSTSWTVAALNACSAGFAAQTCTDFDDGLSPPACVRPGTRTIGQGCRIDDQCASLRCNVTAYPACGTCVARAPAGGACGRDADCVAGLVCNGNRLCVAPRDAGAACDPMTTPCRESLSCRAMTCAAPGGAGTACADQEDCDERRGLLCNVTTLKCGTATAAATCNFTAADGTVSYCADSGACPANGAACVASVGDKQACSNNASGPFCRFPLVCAGGVCTDVLASDCAVTP